MESVSGKFIILRAIKYSEADLIIHALSVNGAKHSFLARSALKSKKRFGGGVLEPSHFVQLTYKPVKEFNQMATLLEAQIDYDFKGIRQSYDKLELALHVLDCIGKVSQEGDVHSEFLFNLTGNTLKAIEVTDDVMILKMHFYLKLLYQQGVISAEPWMAPFLKSNLQESNELKDQQDTVEEYLASIETLVSQYVRTADASF